MGFRHAVFLFLILISSSLFSKNTIQKPQTISTHRLQDFRKNSPAVQRLITSALSLAQRNLGYRYGSADPRRGGMDCSGTVYYLLTTMGVKGVPRSSDSLYRWVLQKGRFHAVKGNRFSFFGFSHLKPGDILFWNGTYRSHRKMSASHVMIYLGKDKASGHLLMVGASNGRTYRGRQVYGVSVFDFQLPRGRDRSQFLGYSCIPQISCSR